MKYFFQFLFLFFFQNFCAQTYVPTDTIHNQHKILSNYFEEKTEQLVNKFKYDLAYNRKLVKQFKKSRLETFENFFEGSYLYFDSEIENYLNQLLKQIIEKNNIKSVDPSQLRIFVSRDTQPNAMSLGDGNFIFTLSLLNRLETEDELIFIIGHELSHYLLQHFEKRFKNKMELLASDSYKEKKKNIKRQRYNKFTKNVEVFKNIEYETKQISRIREFEADSLGFLLFSKVARSPFAATSALSKLDTLSPAEIIKLNADVLRDHFSTKNKAFNEDWTSGVDYTKYNYQNGKINLFGIHKDSLKTHPEIQDRIAELNKILPENKEAPSLESKSWKKIKEKVRLEDVYAHLCSDEYGRGIYFIIQLQNLNNPTPKQSVFYNEMLSLFYYRLHEARKSYTFGKYVDEVDYVNYSAPYNLFLTIIDNLRSSDLQNLSQKFKL